MTEEQILEEIRHALNRKSERPLRTEGWFSLNELRDLMTRDGVRPSDTWVRRRIASQRGEWERMVVAQRVYFRREHEHGKP